MRHDEKYLNSSWPGFTGPERADSVEMCKQYQEHMQRLRPAGEWHDDIGDVLWYRLPVSQPPFVGSPADQGWFTEPVHIFNDGMTNAEYFTHFQIIHVPEN